ncbi:MAG: hypothetical protein ACK53L_36215, partial [Pirellulaceae bacterium]
MASSPLAATATQRCPRSVEPWPLASPPNFGTLPMDRRRALKTLFCFSTLATGPAWRLAAATPPSATAQHLLAIGDFGTTG